MCDEEVMSLIAEKLGSDLIVRIECDGRGSKCGSRESTGKAGEFCLPI